MEKTTMIKTFIAGIGAFFSAKLGILWLVLPILLAVMIIDYATGMTAGKKENKINSKTGMWGIVKKLMYGVEVLLGIIIDWLIINVCDSIGIKVPTVTFFGLLVAIWLIVNEIISILENLTRIGTPMPPFLVKIVSTFKVAVEHSGDNITDAVDKSINKQD